MQWESNTDQSTSPATIGDEHASINATETFKTTSRPALDPYTAKLERFELFSTNQCYYLVGCNKQNNAYRVLKMDRTMIERPSDSGKVSPLQKNMIGRSSFDGSQVGGMAINSDIPTVQLADNSHTAKPTLRPLSDFLTEDPNVYSQEEIKDMLEMIHDGNRMIRADGKPEGQSKGGGLNPIVKAYGIVGFIRFLDCYYLTLTTRRAKVGSIGDNTIYTIKNTETIPLKPAERRSGTDDGADPSSVLLSMWNRGKRSVGLGLTNREIAELRYQGLYQVVDLSKNFFFSYTYDLTRSLQGNFLATTTKLFPPPRSTDMYSWNFFLTREFEGCVNSESSYYWIMPIIHGAFDQRKVNDYGRCMNVTLLARRSRHFAGTRYLKRGVSEQGKVANDVEYEQILHDEPGTFASFLQVRGSIPIFWVQESSVALPKPPIELNRVDPTYTATQLHFADLLKRYSSPILVLDLVKQSEKREREVRVGNEFRRAIDYINHSIEAPHKIRYCALDYSHISKHRNLDVSYALNEVATWAVNQTGFFCSAPKWKIKEGGVVLPFSAEDGYKAVQLTKQLKVPVFPMEQAGVLRTNCIDCLDRTNVAQFSAGVEALGQQLVVMGIRSQCKLGPSSSFVRVLIDLYVDIGDSIALQYGGSEAHKKVTAGVSESIAGPIGKHKELLTSIRRYYSNAFTDRLKQDAMNLFLGYYLPFRHSIPLWEMENDYYLHNFHVQNARNATSSMMTHERAFGINWRNDEETCSRESPTKIKSPGRHKGSATSLSKSSRYHYSNDDIRENSLFVESERVTRVRNRCNKQNSVLSSWWREALQANLQARMSVLVGKRYEESVLSGRFERAYQPEKLGQFDRVFSRAWETPVRRTHAAQHSEGVEADDASDFSRIISIDFFSSSNVDKRQPHAIAAYKISLRNFVKTYGYSPRTKSKLKLFVQHFHEQSEVRSDFDSLSHSDGAPPTILPEEYKKYCEPLSEVYLPPELGRFDEFNKELHDLSLIADDVTGINELARSSHLGESLCYGEYRGLNKDVSAIEVATALHEQFINQDSLLPTGLHVAEYELARKGFDTIGIKESAVAGWKRFAMTEKEYCEIVESKTAQCLRSGLTTENSLQLYASEFDDDYALKTADCIFLQAYQHEYPKNDRHQLYSNRSKEATPFFQKAGRLGIAITPHEQTTSKVHPSLFQSDHPKSISAEFEQINEDMFSRKENKFMVFNGAGVDSWKGTQSITKACHFSITSSASI